MDDLITYFINNKFSPELAIDINFAFSLLDKFNYPDLYDPFIDIITTDQLVDSVSITDNFLTQLKKDMRHLLKIHSLDMSFDTPLDMLNKLAEFFFNIMFLEDYEMINMTLASDMNDEEMFLQMVTEYTTLDEASILEHITEIGTFLIKTIKIFVNNKTGTKFEPMSDKELSIQKEIIKDMKVFSKYISADAVGVQLTLLGLPLHQPFDVYFELGSKLFNTTSAEALANDFLSLAMISTDRDKNPKTVFNEHSGSIAANLADLLSIEHALDVSYIKFIQLRKVDNE